jgi:hypothetical protein
MNTCPTPGEVSEFDISGLEAMLAGTLCLMSAYSHCSCSGEDGSSQSHTNQGLIGLKIVSNLSCLQYQNSLSPEFRRVLGKVCDAWRQHSLRWASEHMPSNIAAPKVASALSNPSPTATFWHPTPQAVQ